ncbi:hypothetical protein D918_01463 [Trichuris suis]|nr:hypothetical protein D918_01463 [Trichuris suis]
MKETYRSNEINGRYGNIGSSGGRYGSFEGLLGDFGLNYGTAFGDDVRQKNQMKWSFRSSEVNGHYGNIGSYGGRYGHIGDSHDDIESNHGATFVSDLRQKSQTKQSYRSYEVNRHYENTGGYGKRYGDMEGGHGGTEFNYVSNGDSDNYKLNKKYTFNVIFEGNGAKRGNGAYEDHEDNYAYGGHESHAESTDQGCEVDSGRRLNFGETYRKGNFILKCEKVGTNTAVTPIKCILDETELHIGERKRKGGFAYACQKTMTGIALGIVGCFGDNGAFAEFGETFIVNNFVFMCTKDGDSGIHKAYGCLIEGRQVKIGQTVQLGAYSYKCSQSGDRGLRTEVIGCLGKSGRQIDVGERYRDGPFLYQCRKTESGVRAALIGCVAKVSGFDKEFAFGESWNTDTSSPLSYKMKCIGNETSATTEITHCVAKLEYASSVISVGNSVQLPSTMMVFTCRRQRDGKVTGRVMPCDEFERIEPGFTCGRTRF